MLHSCDRYGPHLMRLTNNTDYSFVYTVHVYVCVFECVIEATLFTFALIAHKAGGVFL